MTKREGSKEENNLQKKARGGFRGLKYYALNFQSNDDEDTNASRRLLLEHKVRLLNRVRRKTERTGTGRPERGELAHPTRIREN